MLFQKIWSLLKVFGLIVLISFLATPVAATDKKFNFIREIIDLEITSFPQKGIQHFSWVGGEFYRENAAPVFQQLTLNDPYEFEISYSLSPSTADILSPTVIPKTFRLGTNFIKNKALKKVVKVFRFIFAILKKLFPLE